MYSQDCIQKSHDILEIDEQMRSIIWCHVCLFNLEINTANAELPNMHPTHAPCYARLQIEVLIDLLLVFRPVHLADPLSLPPLSSALAPSPTIFLSSHSLVNSRLSMLRSLTSSLQDCIRAALGVSDPSVCMRRMNSLAICKILVSVAFLQFTSET